MINLLIDPVIQILELCNIGFSIGLINRCAIRVIMSESFTYILNINHHMIWIKPQMRVRSAMLTLCVCP